MANTPSSENLTDTKDAIQASIIISYYRQPGHLRLVLDALSKQSDNRFEVIVAEDDEAAETVQLISDYQSKLPFHLRHVSHANTGYRKCVIMNEGAKIARGRVLIFIDADCIPHPYFVKGYLNCTSDGVLACGRRVMLSQSLTDKFMSSPSFDRPGLVQLLRSGSSKLTNALYFPWFPLTTSSPALLGCNWAISREDYIRLNGLDEDYVDHMSEETDLEWRSRKSGMSVEWAKNRAVVYHLDHSYSWNEDLYKRSMAKVEEKKAKGLVRCVNGLEKIRQEVT